jgi:aminoglycoside phosphotransferase (APT) family kinase protein/kynurenine formamidase
MTGQEAARAVLEADVVATYADAEGMGLAPLLILEGLEPYLPGDGDIDVQRLGIGHSNETFKISRGGQSWVLRRPPRPPYAPTAHDVVREYRILAALADENVRSPRPHAVCADTAAIGAPFYLMELVEGDVVRDRFPAALDLPEERRRALEEFVDALVEIHAVPWQGTALEQIGRPSGYLERQLRRWKGQWEHNQTRPVPDIDRMGAWLSDNLPADHETTLVHGDYKLDNALFALEPPARLAVIVDWEMSTLGAPLADLGLLCATYVEAGETPDEVLDFSPATGAPGSLTRDEIVERYARRSGRAVDNLAWYEGLALWKIAILLEGSYQRFLAGTTADPFFVLLEDGVPRLAARAFRYTKALGGTRMTDQTAARGTDRTAEQGPISGVGDDDVLAALALARRGHVYDLEIERFRGMPLHPAHPQIEIVSFRTPQGIQNQRDQAWLNEGNSDNMAFISDLVVGTVHSGTHIDALAHVTVGEDNHWYGGNAASEKLGDWGPLVCDASALPPIVTRGVLLDVAGHRGVDVLAKGEGISADLLKEVAEAQGVEVRPKDTVLVRTGYVSLFPDAARMAEHSGPGIDSSAARWLVEQGVVCAVGDTETLEQIPCADPNNPHAVHTILLVEAGVYIVEMANMEQLAADRAYEFAFVALPCKIRGATGSMIRPIAIV